MNFLPDIRKGLWVIFPILVLTLGAIFYSTVIQNKWFLLIFWGVFGLLYPLFESKDKDLERFLKFSLMALLSLSVIFFGLSWYSDAIQESPTISSGDFEVHLIYYPNNKVSIHQFNLDYSLVNNSGSISFEIDKINSGEYGFIQLVLPKEIIINNVSVNSELEGYNYSSEITHFDDELVLLINLLEDTNSDLKVNILFEQGFSGNGKYSILMSNVIHFYDNNRQGLVSFDIGEDICNGECVYDILNVESLVTVPEIKISAENEEQAQQYLFSLNTIDQDKSREEAYKTAISLGFVLAGFAILLEFCWRFIKEVFLEIKEMSPSYNHIWNIIKKKMNSKNSKRKVTKSKKNSTNVNKPRFIGKGEYVIAILITGFILFFGFISANSPKESFESMIWEFILFGIILGAFVIGIKVDGINVASIGMASVFGSITILLGHSINLFAEANEWNFFVEGSNIILFVGVWIITCSLAMLFYKFGKYLLVKIKNYLFGGAKEE